MVEPKRLSLDEVFDLARHILLSAGASETNAEAVAEVVTAAEADECASHGVYRLLGYAAALRGSRVDGSSIPNVVVGRGGIVRVDAMRGFAPLAVKLGRPRLIEKAKEIGVAALAISQCYHFSALWIDVEKLAEAGLAVLACTIGQRRVAAYGGTRPLLGTNPIAFGWPRENARPFVFDLATSAVARGEIELRARSGEPLPIGWALDGRGTPTTVAAEALAGVLLPFGGHKGAALSIMVELLAGALMGQRPGFETASEGVAEQGPRLGGEFIIALDTRYFGDAPDGSAVARAESFFDDLEEEGHGRIPSSRRYLARERTHRDGIVVPGALYEELKTLAPLKRNRRAITAGATRPVRG